MRPGTDLADAAEQPVKPLGERGFECLSVEPHQSVDLRALADPDHARSMSIGERHRGHRAALPVQLDRNVAMRRGMGEARGDRGLSIMLHGSGDLRGFAADRIPPVGADHEPRGNLPPLFAAEMRAVRVKRDAVDVRGLKQGEGGGSSSV